MILAYKLPAAGHSGTAWRVARETDNRIAQADRRCYNICAPLEAVAELEKTLKQYLEYFEAFATVLLVLAGIGGISYHLFRDDGWLEMAFGNIFALHVQYPLIAIPVTFATIVMIRMWRQNLLATGRLKQLPNIFIYTLMAVGVYFIGYFWINGHL